MTCPRVSARVNCPLGSLCTNHLIPPRRTRSRDQRSERDHRKGCQHSNHSPIIEYGDAQIMAATLRKNHQCVTKATHTAQCGNASRHQVRAGDTGLRMHLIANFCAPLCSVTDYCKASWLSRLLKINRRYSIHSRRYRS